MSLADPYLVEDTPGRRVWRGDGWEMREGRWEDAPPEVVDHVIADPPFGAQQSANAKQRVGLVTKAERCRLERLGVALPTHGCNGLTFDGIDPAVIGPPLVAIARRWVVLFCAIEQTGEYKAACPDAYLRGGWWDKTNAAPQFTGDRPAMPGEAIVAMHRPRCRRWNSGGKALRYRGASSHATGLDGDEGVAGRLHETQKPLWLMRALILDFTDPGELIFDPYAGSATTGVACLQLGRRFIGHEMQSHYAEVAAERLVAAQHGQTLAQARAGQGRLFDDEGRR